MTPNDYPPATPKSRLNSSEENFHSFRIRGFRYGMLLPKPVQEVYIAHLTSRRFLLEAEENGSTISVEWGDIIEFEQIRGTRAADEFPGAEDHMIHAVTRNSELLSPSEYFLFVAEPIEGTKPDDTPEHCAAFLGIADNLLLEAFEAEN